LVVVAPVAYRAMTNHLLEDELYAAYASGVLSPPMVLLIDAQASMDGGAARQREDAEAVTGLLLENLGPAPVKAEALAEIFSTIDAEATQSTQPDSVPKDVSSCPAARAAGKAIEELLCLPSVVRDLALDKGGWSFAGPGVRTLELMHHGDAKAELIRMEPGRSVPRHSHNSQEFTLVLAGGFSDGRDSYTLGDICVVDPGVIHKPVADPGEACIVLAVTDGPPSFTGPLGWIQRVLGR